MKTNNILNLLLILFLLYLIIYCLFIKLSKTEYFSDDRLFFIHIPKTAGTSIEDAFKKNNIDMGRHYFYKVKNRNKVIENPPNISLWHIPMHLFKNEFHKNKIYFTVVRNPYTRLLSEYKWQTYRLKKNKDDLNTFIKNKLHEYMNDYTINDGHFIPQSEYIKDIKCDNILHLENLKEDFKYLLEKYNYNDIELSHSNKMPNKKNITVDNFNSENIKLINQIYKDDFIKFNYEIINI